MKAKRKRTSSDPRLRMAMGRRVAARRLALSLTQRDLADAIGCDHTHVSCLEHGVTSPGLAKVPGLCRALAMTPNELFGWHAEGGRA